jgi:CreA protein
MNKIILAALLAVSSMATAQPIGEVSTSFKLLGPNNKIIVEAFDDPKVNNAVCYLSKSKTGGLIGAIGFAEDTSDASIACRGIGAVSLKGSIPDNEEVFNESRSVLFKKLRVVRLYDKQRQVIVYLAYSDKLIDGSPKNSVSVVPIR